ncbi:MAG TPA: 6-bladed beta-propeller [Longimicrobiales bacterium]|nr:6-bladed beta-propeller [Longimicrobiales bacterium]
MTQHARRTGAALLIALSPPSAVGAQTALQSLAAPVFDLGTAEGPEHLAFGEVADAAASADGSRLFFLDRMRGRVSVFTRDGEFVTEAGSRGQGPSEFIQPHALTVMGSRIFVLDRGKMRVEVLAFEGDSLRFEGGFRMAFDADDLCALQGQLYFMAYANSHVVQRLSPDGTPISSFGDPFLTDPVLADATAVAHLLCDERSQSLLVVGNLLPIVRRYDREGRLRWETTLPGYTATVIDRSERGGVRYSNPGTSIAPDLTISAALFGDTLFVQFGKVASGMGSLQDVLEVRTVAVGVDTGETVPVRARVPRIDKVLGDLAVSYANDPYPRIRGYRIRGSGRTP